MLIEIPDDIPAIELARFAASQGCTFAPTLNDRIMLKLVHNSEHEITRLANQVRKIAPDTEEPGPAAA